MKTLAVLAVLALAFLAAGCDEESSCCMNFDDSTTVPPTSTADPYEAIHLLAAFAKSPNKKTWADVPLADTVLLGLGSRIRERHSDVELLDPATWRIGTSQTWFRSGVGPFSALRQLARYDGDVVHSRERHMRCVSPPGPAPKAVRTLRRISIQPAAPDSCGMWFSVDVFLTKTGKIRAVTLDYYEP